MKSFNTSLSIAVWYVTLYYALFYFLWLNNCQNEVFFNIFLLSNKWNYYNMFYVGGLYSTINDTLMIHFSPIMKIVGRKFLCGSIMAILLMFIIRWRLIMWYLLWSTIIIGRTDCFMRTPIPFWTIFIRAVWYMLYKYSQ